MWQVTNINRWVDPQWRIEQDMIKQMLQQLSASRHVHQVARQWQERIQHVISDVLPWRLHTASTSTRYINSATLCLKNVAYVIF